MRKVLLSLIGSLVAASVFGQDSGTKSFADDPFSHPQMPLFIVIGFVFVVLMLVIIVSFVLVRAFNMLVEQTERERAKASGVAYKPRETIFSKFSQAINASVPLEKEKDIDLGHDFDGIRELDNHLPPWWKWLFYGTIGWSAVYIFIFHFSSTMPLQHEEYDTEVAAAEESKRAYLASQPQATIDVETLQYSADAEIIAKGKAVFSDNNCGSCHRSDGGGNSIGPNLTDEYWLHGGHVKQVFTTVRDGFVDKGMPAWGGSLSPTQVRDVTFYILSLQGSNPPNAKAPQGELIKIETPKADTVKAQASL